MLTGTGAWREEIGRWWPGVLPARPDLGDYYPWPTVVAHSMTRGYGRRVEDALTVLRAASEAGRTWALNLSGGKDSTALAVLCDEAGWRPRAVSCRDDLCWPGEDAYLRSLAVRCELELVFARVPVDLLEEARRHPGSLSTGDMESAAHPLGRHWYATLDRIAVDMGTTGLLWGVRAGENSGRAMNYARRGELYERTDGTAICAPLSRWSSLDVHAYLAAHDVPLMPTYLCVDPDADAMLMRHSWWVRAGRGAGHHYRWLKRWWPALWERAVEVDPGVLLVA